MKEELDKIEKEIANLPEEELHEIYGEALLEIADELRKKGKIKEASQIIIKGEELWSKGYIKPESKALRKLSKKDKEHYEKVAEELAEKGEIGWAGKICAMIGNKEKAEEYARRCEKEECFCSAGEIYAMIGNTEKAEECAEKAAEKGSVSYDVCCSLARTYGMIGNKEKASEYAKKVAKEGSFLDLQIAGKLEAKAGNVEKAEEYAKKLIRSGETDKAGEIIFMALENYLKR